MIDAHRVVFNGMDSLDLDITPHLSFDGDNGGSASFLNRDSIHSEHYDGSFRRIHSYKYNEVLSPTFTFLKQDFENFTPEENRRILSWLTASDKPGWIEIYQDDSNVLSYKLFGNFIETEVYKLGSGRVVGYVATFESSSPYAWSQKYETTKQILKSGSFDITCNSDEYNKLLYPKVTVTFTGENIYLPADKNPMDSTYVMIPKVIYSYEGNLYININTGDIEDQGKFQILGSLASNSMANSYTVGHYYFPSEQVVKKTIAVTNDDGTVSYAWKTVSTVGAAVKINNITTSKETTIAGGTIGETIIFDGANKVVSSDKDTTVKIIGDDFNWVWPAFVVDTNSFAVTGSCNIKFEWIEPRKVGNV